MQKRFLESPWVVKMGIASKKRITPEQEPEIAVLKVGVHVEPR